MNGKRIGNEWNLYAVALGGMCLGAFAVRALAWRVGNNANALGLLGVHFVRALLLLFAWVLVVTLLKAAARREKPAPSGRLSVLDGIGAVLLFPGCLGCYPLWPAVLVLLTAQLILTPLFRPADDRPARPDLLRAGVAVVLYTVTWYVCATASRQAVRGLGERIEARGGSDRLRAWADDVIAAHERRRRTFPTVGASAVALLASPHGAVLTTAALLAGRAEPRGDLTPDEVPDWVDGLLGPFQGIRSIRIEDDGGTACVVLRTGGSAYHFRIQVCPARTESPPGWFGDLGSEWRPGIDVGTEGK